MKLNSLFRIFYSITPAFVKKPIRSLVKLLRPKAFIPSKLGSYVYNEVENLLSNQRIVLVDIGGAVNLQPHFHKLIGKTDFIVYEPDERSYHDLINTVSRYQDSSAFRYVNQALSGEGGVRTLYLTNVPTGSSILPINTTSPLHSFQNNYFYPIREIPINTSCLRDSLNELNIGEIDILKLDVQGAEFEIIKGLDSPRMGSLLAIEMEIGFFETYIGQTKFCEVEEFMKKNGFVLFDLRLNRINVPEIVDNIPYSEKYFNVSDKSPSIAQRIYEVDVIYMRDINWLMDQNVPVGKILKMIVLYCVYNFFTEAIQLLNRILKLKMITKTMHDQYLVSIKSWNLIEQKRLKDYDYYLRSKNYQVWGQYMSVPYPSN